MKRLGNSAQTRKAAACCLVFVLLFSLLIPGSPSYAENVSVNAAPLSRSMPVENGMVRVYLSSLGNPTALHLTLQGEYLLGATGIRLPGGTAATVGFHQGTGALSITYNGQTIQMGNAFSLSRSTASGTNGILIRESRDSGNPYPGDLFFESVWTNGSFKLYTIAHVYIEDYLYGVLPYEMGNSWPLEALKAQAVAARTYTVRMMNSRASGRYDVQDTTSDQTYRGTPSGKANCVTAVDETRGIVLTYGSDYVTTYYSSSNGGQTEISRSGSVPGYMKVKDDPFDYASANATVRKANVYTDLQSSSNSSALISLLRQKAAAILNRQGYAASEYLTLKTLNNVTPHTPKYAHPSRLYTKLDFSMEVQTRTYSGLITTLTVTVTCDVFHELESILSMGIQSSQNELWSVAQKNGFFQLQARRYGHGMGMSQYGAMQMAYQGYTYDQILGFYYEGCSRVQHSFTSSILSGTGDQNVVIQPPVELEPVVPGACSGTVSLTNVADFQSIHSAKSIGASVIGKAPAGAVLEVILSDGSWCFVRYGELYGYVPESAVDYTGTPNGADTGATSVAGVARVTANDYINLRAAETTSAKVLGTAPAGAEVTVFSVNSPWAKVQYNALVAYAHTDYLSGVMQESPETLPAIGQTMYVWSQDGGSVNLREEPSTLSTVLTLIPYGSTVEKLAEYGSWTRVEYRDWTGYILSSLLMEQEPEQSETTPDHNESLPTETAVVNTSFDSLNLRAAANAYSLVVTAIPKGAKVSVLSRGMEWSQVSWNGFAGYVMSQYLSFSDDDTDDDQLENKTAFVSTPGGVLNMRSVPWIGGAVVRQLQPGQSVIILEYGDEWSQVSVDGTVGFVMTDFLTFSAPSVSQPDASLPTISTAKAVVSTPGGSLNLRAAPSIYAEVLTLIPQGAGVEVLSRGDSWCEIRYEAWQGFVMTSMLRFDVASSPGLPQTQSAWVDTPAGVLNLRSEPNSLSALVTVIPRLSEVTVTRYDQEWCAVRYGQDTGYVMTRYLSFEPLSDAESDTGMPNETEAVDVWIHTASGSLNLRQEPDLFSGVVTTIPRGAAAKMLIEGNEWSYLLYNGHYGYAMTRYLRMEENSGFSDNEAALRQPETDTYATVFSRTALWPACQEDGIPLGYVPSGSEVHVLLTGSEWSCVEFGSLQGFCLTAFLSVNE